MFVSLSAALRRLRTFLVALIAVFTVALFANPAAAAVELAEIDKGAVAAITLIACLLLALVIEVWRSTLHRKNPTRQPAPIKPRRAE